MSSVVIASSLPAHGEFASGSGGGGSSAPITNARLRREYNSETTKGRRIQIRAEQRRLDRVKQDRAAAKKKREAAARRAAAAANRR